jgi:hypothetical protein
VSTGLGLVPPPPVSTGLGLVPPPPVSTGLGLVPPPVTNGSDSDDDTFGGARLSSSSQIQMGGFTQDQVQVLFNTFTPEQKCLLYVLSTIVFSTQDRVALASSLPNPSASSQASIQVPYSAMKNDPLTMKYYNSTFTGYSKGGEFYYVPIELFNKEADYNQQFIDNEGQITELVDSIKTILADNTITPYKSDTSSDMIIAYTEKDVQGQLNIIRELKLILKNIKYLFSSNQNTTSTKYMKDLINFKLVSAIEQLGSALTKEQAVRDGCQLPKNLTTLMNLIKDVCWNPSIVIRMMDALKMVCNNVKSELSLTQTFLANLKPPPTPPPASAEPASAEPASDIDAVMSTSGQGEEPSIVDIIKAGIFTQLTKITDIYTQHTATVDEVYTEFESGLIKHCTSMAQMERNKRISSRATGNIMTPQEKARSELPQKDVELEEKLDKDIGALTKQLTTLKSNISISMDEITPTLNKMLENLKAQLEVVQGQKELSELEKKEKKKNGLTKAEISKLKLLRQENSTPTVKKMLKDGLLKAGIERKLSNDLSKLKNAEEDIKQLTFSEFSKKYGSATSPIKTVDADLFANIKNMNELSNKINDKEKEKVEKEMNLSTVQNKMATMIGQIIASKVSATADNYDQILNSVIKNVKVGVGGSTHRKTRRPNIIKHNKKRTITKKKHVVKMLNTLGNHNH